MDLSFEKGWDFFINNSSIYASQIESIDWIKNINKEITSLENSINALGRNNQNTDIATLKGFAAEEWHAGTFNINAALNKSTNRATVLEGDRHILGSPDVRIDTKNGFIDNGLKYYKNGVKSAKAQSISFHERYMEYLSKGNDVSFKDYMKQNGFEKLDIDTILDDPLYKGQFRVIPSDQFKDAVEFLEEKIKSESVKRPEQVERYKDTLKMLKTKISDNEGNESIELSRKESEKLARLSKKDDFDAKEFGLSTEELISNEKIIKDSLKAGVNAAVLSMVLQLGPELYKTIEYLRQNGEIDIDQVKESGFKVINSGTESFIKGVISCAITMACESGKFGEQLKNPKYSPIISMATVLTINVIKDSFEVARGTMTKGTLVDNLVRDSISTATSLGLGVLGQHVIPVPVLGYLVGSFVGSIIGNYVFEGTKSMALSFCIENGCTLFGIVEQNYKLPEDVINQMGIETFDYEKIDYDKLESESFEFDKIDFDTVTPDSIDIHILRRGVIGVNIIGYTN